LNGIVRVSGLFDILTSLAGPANSLKSMASGDASILSQSILVAFIAG
jgi:hypothetical protein